MKKKKHGLIRESILGKTIEFSARTVITVDPSLPPYKIKVSKKILRRLWAPYFIYYLTRIKEMEEDYCYDTLLSKEVENEALIKKLFDEFLEWFKDNT